MFNTKSTSLYFVFAGGIYFILSMILFFKIAPAQHFEIDSPAYTAQVERFEKTGALTSSVCTNWYGIGYPMFLVAVRVVAGQNYTVCFFAQMLLGFIMLWLTYRLGRRFFDELLALIALGFASINLGFLVYAQYILADLLLTVLSIAAFDFFASYLLEEKNKKKLVFSGLLFGLSMLLKPTVWFLVWVYVVLLLVTKIYNVKIKLLHILLFLSFFMVPVVGLMIRNYNVYGYATFKAVDKVNLYLFFLPKIIAQTEAITFEAAQQKVGALVHVKEYASGKGWEPAHELLLKIVKEHPVLSIKIWLINSIKTLCGFYTNQLKLLLNSSIRGGDCSFFKFSGSCFDAALQYIYFGTTSWFVIALGFFEVAWTLLRILFVLISFCVLWYRKVWISFVLLLFHSGYFLAIGGCDGCARLRLPIEALLIILMVHGMLTVYDFYCSIEKKNR